MKRPKCCGFVESLKDFFVRGVLWGGKSREGAALPHRQCFVFKLRTTSCRYVSVPSVFPSTPSSWSSQGVMRLRIQRKPCKTQGQLHFFCELGAWGGRPFTWNKECGGRRPYSLAGIRTFLVYPVSGRRPAGKPQKKGASWVHCLREAPELFGENAELIEKKIL